MQGSFSEKVLPVSARLSSTAIPLGVRVSYTGPVMTVGALRLSDVLTPAVTLARRGIPKA